MLVRYVAVGFLQANVKPSTLHLKLGFSDEGLKFKLQCLIPTPKLKQKILRSSLRPCKP